MKLSYLNLLAGSILLLVSCSKHQTPITEFPEMNWADASWIGLEELPDSLKIIPGVHGSGDQLGEKGIIRPIIPQFRKEFRVTKPVQEAVLLISGLGHYTLRLDGKSLDDRFLAPGWTLYSKTCFYNGYDLTPALKKGRHVIGVTVGNGFFNVNRERYRKLVTAWGLPMMRMKMRVVYKDGTEEILVSDESWKVSASPTTYTSIYGGEDYDARLEQEGWMEQGFDDSGWKSARIVQGPGGEMREEKDYPLKVMQSFQPEKFTELPDGSFVYDFGQNASGIPEIRVKGNPGQAVRLTPGELIDDAGQVTQQASGGPSFFEYTLAGGREESWKPSFTYYGFRYLSVKGAVPKGYPNPDNLPVMEDLLFHHTRNSAPTVGHFKCSNDLFNQIYELIDWSVKSNFASVTTDCPHREKLGWLEVPHLMGTSLQYVYDIQPLYNKIVDDMMDSQLDNGLVPDIAPEYVPFVGGFRDSPEWGSSAVILPWYLYEWYGDTQPMERAWDMMTRYMSYLDSLSSGSILSHGLGDWFDLGQQSPGSSQLTPLALTATAIWFYDLSLLSKMADIVGFTDASRAYSDRAGEVQQAFLDRFYDADSHVVATGSQTAYAMPLVVGLIPEADREAVTQNLMAAIERDGYALTAGDVGFHYLVRALQDAGAHELIWKMNARDDVPGYGYQLKKGATALTESWPALRFVSNNHMMLGHLMEWLYSGIGGIRQAEGSIAYEHLIIDPQPVGDLTWAEVSHQCIKGEIFMRWDQTGFGYEMELRIPEGADAQVSFGGKPLGLFTSGKYLLKIPGPEQLQSVYEEVKTPFKYGIVLKGDAGGLVDCPSVFKHGDRWYMIYISMDKRGYETQLAESSDLLSWKPLGKILPFTEQGTWDANQAAGYISLQDPQWGGSAELGTYDNKYWLSYLGGALEGYETDPLAIGMAWTNDPSQAKPWNRIPKPVLSRDQQDCRYWEQLTQYKSTIIQDQEKSLGWPFVMFYNGKTKSGYERIGMAVSENMTDWTRFGEDPVIDNGSGISGDPQIVKIGDLWVMFYFGAFYQPKAFDTFACSYDLVHWVKWEGQHLVEPSEPWDQQYAHKPWIIKHDGVVYHYYCAVGDQGRVIALATSKDLSGL